MINLNDIKKLLITLLALSLIALCLSCGSRKTQKSNVTELSKVKQTAKVDNNIETKKETQTVINDETNELEITPIDTSKVLIVNGKIYKNAKVKLVNRKLQTKTDSKETIKDKTKSENKAVTATKKEVKTNNTERKSNPFTTLLWLLIPAIGFVIWKYKYKIVGL